MSAERFRDGIHDAMSTRIWIAFAIFIAKIPLANTERSCVRELLSHFCSPHIASPEYGLIQSGAFLISCFNRTGTFRGHCTK